MPLTDRDPNVSGRTSRTSTTSTGSRGLQKSNGHRNDMVPGGAGVMSMLKTSTELGDLGAFSGNSRMPPLPRQNNRRSGAARMSTSSNHSHHSRHASSRHRPRPSTSSSTRRSLTSNVAAPHFSLDAHSATGSSSADPHSALPPARVSKDARSFSMTHTEPPFTLSNQASFSSLRSHDANSRPRSPFRYPTRLKRPGYRPASPALSDISGVYPRTVQAVVPSSQSSKSKGVSNPKSQPATFGERTQTVFSDLYERYLPSFAGGAADPPRDGTFEPAPRRTDMTPMASDISILNGYTTSGESSSPENPSSDYPSSSVPATPATPHDDSPMEVLLSPTVAGLLAAEFNGSLKHGAKSRPLYYDYTEQFDRGSKPEQIFEPDTIPVNPLHVPMGFVHRIKTILEERATPEQHSQTNDSSVHSSVSDLAELPGSPPVIAELPAEEVIRPVELPAEPTAKRITREMIVSVLQSSEKSEDTTSASISAEIKNYVAQNGSLASNSGQDLAAVASSVGTTSDKRNSTVSEAATTQSNSSVPEHEFEFPSKVPSKSLDVPTEGVKLPTASSTPILATPAVVDHSGFGAKYKSLGSKVMEVAKTMRTSMESAPSKSDGQSKERSSNPVTGSSTAVNPRPPTPMTFSSNVSRSNTLSNRSGVGPTEASTHELGRATSESNKPEPTSKRDSASSISHDTPTSAPRTDSRQSPSPPAVTVSSPVGTSSGSHFWSFRKSFSSPTYSVDAVMSANGYHDGLANNMKLSAPHYPGSYLPDVKEESHEGSSLNDSRPTSFKFPRSHKIIPKQSMDDLRRSGRVSALSDPIQASPKHVFETGMIPSFNFSQVDLISKMNEELEGRSTRSTGVYSNQFNYREFLSPSPCRPKSSKTIREKYKSFFASLDDLDPPVQGAPVRSSMAMSNSIRSYSPDDVIDEVKRLSIPSVGVLAHRLSELLPSFKRYYAGSNSNKDENSTIIEEEMQDMGGKVVHPERSSRRLRPLPGLADLVVVDDEVFERITQKPNEANSAVGGRGVSGLDGGETAPDRERCMTPVAELEAPLPAFLRAHATPELVEGGENLTPARSNMASSRSPGDNRPWNHDKNYPWAGTDPAIDISLPAPVHTRDESSRAVSRLRSEASHISAGSPTPTRNLAEITNLSAAGSYVLQDDSMCHEPIKRSMFGCIKDKIGLSRAVTESCWTSGPADILGREDRVVDPGDRYPTTGLTPPATFNIDEVRSFFSDDSSQSRKRGTLRRRLTSLRVRMPVSRTGSALENHSIERVANDGAPEEEPVEESPPVLRVQTYNGTSGMGRMEFRARKVVEKIKMLWHRGGQFMRSCATGQKLQKRRHITTISDSDLQTTA